MGFLGKSVVFVVLIAIFVGYKLNNLFKPPPVPKLPDTWWGNGDPWREDKSIRSFAVNVSDEVLKDLKYRLDHARDFTPPLEGVGQEYGLNTNLLKEIVDFWKTKYNWRKREPLFNKYPQFVTSIQGLDIHFVHVKPETKLKTLPLLLLHGWPGSYREFFEAIPLLTTPRKDQDFVFEVVVASLPGYGFSQAAVRPGLGAAEMAIVFKNLMKRLGFSRYYGQGGDFGAIVLQHLAALHPEVLLGFHNNMCIVNTPLSVLKLFIGSIYPTWFVKEDHLDRVYPLSKEFAFKLRETGYLHIQATKPDTIGVALRDSPVGLAAYILEKFVTGTNFNALNRVDGDLKKVWDYADLLDNVMVYWVTGSMPTAMRLYSETFNSQLTSRRITSIPIQVPTACARFRNDFYSPDGVLGEVYPNLLQLTDHEGGHFAAFQVAQVLVDDVYAAVKKFEEYNARKE